MGVGHQSSRQAFNVRVQLPYHLNLYFQQQLLCDPRLPTLDQSICIRWKRALKWSLTLSLESKQTGNTVVQLPKHKFCSDYNKTKLLSVQTGGWQEGSVDKKSEHPTKPDSLILNPRTYHHYVERTYSKLSSDLHTYYPMHIK